VLDGELAVPCNPKSAYAGLNSLHENLALALPLIEPAEGVELT